MQFSKEIQQPTSMDSGFFGFKTGLQMHTESSKTFRNQVALFFNVSYSKVKDFIVNYPKHLTNLKKSKISRKPVASLCLPQPKETRLR